MKRQTPTTKTIGDYNYYIYPFGALIASRLTGDLVALVTPMLGAAAPLIGKQLDAESGNLFDMKVEELDPALSGAFASLTGEKVESLMRQLLIDHKNVYFEGVGDEKPQLLTAEDLNEIFCMDLQDMYLLAWEVLKLNFQGFFKKLSTQSGDLGTLVEKVTKAKSGGTENLT